MSDGQPQQNDEASVELGGSGARMPLVGLGTWKIPKDVAADAVRQAIEKGYRLLDLAADYGNEKEVGDGIRAAIENGTVKREELFVTSKLWNTFHAPEHVRPAMERTLRDTGLEYVDLYLIHFPISLEYVPFEERYPPGWLTGPEPEDGGPRPPYKEAPVPIADTWRAMEGLVDAGLARNIGVSNFTVPLMMDVLRYARIRPAALQFEMHPYLVQPRLMDWCRRNGIRMTAYSSFGPVSYKPFGFVDDVPTLLEHDAVRRVAEEAGRTAGQVLLRWAVQQGVAVIPKSSNPERLAGNRDLFGWSLTDAQMSALTELNANRRFNDPANYLDPPVPIFD